MVELKPLSAPDETTFSSHRVGQIWHMPRYGVTFIVVSRTMWRVGVLESLYGRFGWVVGGVGTLADWRDDMYERLV